MQKGRCIFVSITPNFPIDQCSSTVLHLTFPSGRTAFYGMVKNSYATLSRDITVEYTTRHFYFLGIHTHLKARVCIPENTSDSRDILQYSTRKRCITSMYQRSYLNCRKTHKDMIDHRSYTHNFKSNCQIIL